jgi:hypothetical protein
MTVGQKVRCIKDSDWIIEDGAPVDKQPVKGKVYVVTSIVPFTERQKDDFRLLEDYGFTLKGFLPDIIFTSRRFESVQE